jgi:hypothetical protein
VVIADLAAVMKCIPPASGQSAFRWDMPAWISPPLSISSDEIHDMMGRLDSALTEWESAVL